MFGRRDGLLSRSDLIEGLVIRYLIDGCSAWHGGFLVDTRRDAVVL